MNWNVVISPVKERQAWSEVELGLRQIVIGYVILCIGGILACLAVAAAAQPPLLAPLQLSSFADRDTLLLASLSLVLMAVLGYLLMLVLGQWRCVKFTPASCGVRECMFACIIFSALASVMGIFLLLFGTQSLAIQQTRLADTDYLGTLRGLIAIFIAALVVLHFLVFNYYLQVLRGWFDQDLGEKKVDLFFLYTSLLIGASIGILMHWEQIPFQAPLVGTLSLGWFACFAWHYHRIRKVRACIAERLA